MEDSNICGIVVAKSLDGSPVNQVIVNQYFKQKARGSEGFGVFDGLHTVKNAKQRKVLGWIKKERNNSDFLMFHHRMPTSTINVRRACHPFSTGDFFGDTRYVLVHNGVLYNEDKLKPEHEKLGIEYRSVLDNGSYNDSEALLWDFALTMEGKQDEMKAYGGIAFVCAKLVKGQIEKLYFGKNPGRPLHLFRDKVGVMLSSEGDGEDIDDHKLYTYHYKSNRITTRPFRIPSCNPDSTYISNASRNPASNSWNYYTPGSIAAHAEEIRQNRSRYTDKEWWEDGEYGVDYYIDNDGYVVYIEDEDDSYADAAYNEEFETLPLPKVTSKATTAPQITLEELSDIQEEDSDEIVAQKMFLKEFPYSDPDVRAHRVYTSYMVEQMGVYDSAYWAMEADYELFEQHEESPMKNQCMALLQAAMNVLFRQGGYVDSNSVDPAFATHNQQLALGAGEDE